MGVELILGASLFLQLVAAGLAVWLIRVTGRRLAWALIASGIMLMALRRAIALSDALAGDAVHRPDLSAELVGLGVSIIMITGLALIVPLFRSIRGSEEAALKSEQRYRAIIEDQTELVCRCLPDSTLTFVNDTYCRYFGKTHEQLVGSRFLRLIPTEHHQQLLEGFASLGAENRVLTHEHPVISADGEIRWQQWTNRAILGTNQRIAEIQAVGRDITERKRAEDALRESEQRLKHLVSASPAGIYSCGPGPQYPITFISRNISAQLGYEPHEFYNDPHSWTKLIHPDDAARVLEELARIETGGRTLHEYRFRHKQGHDVWLHDQALAVRDEAGNVVGVVGSWLDVTSRKRAEEDLRRAHEDLEQRVAERTADLAQVNERLEQEAAERERALTALHQSEEKYRQLFGTVSDAILIFDAETCGLLDVNAAAADLYGYQRQELLELTVVDVSAEPERTEAAVRETIAGMRRSIPLRYHKKKDGTIFPVEISTTAFLWEGRCVVCGIMRDITARIRAQDELAASERRFTSLLQSLDDVVWKATADGSRMLYVNPAAERVFGRSADEFLEDPHLWLDVVHPDDRERAAQSGRELFQQGSTEAVYRIIRPNGQIRWISDRKNLVRDETGKPVRVGGIATDVTERKNAENALRESEARFRSLSAAAPIGIFLTDKEGRTTYANEYLQEISGLSREQCLDRGWQQAVHPEDRDAVMKETLETGRTGAPYIGQFRIVTPEGVERWVDIHSVVMRSADGELMGKVGTVQDITDRKLAEQNARESSAQLEKLAEEQQTLLQNTRDFLYHHDTRGIFTYLSPAVEQITGYTVDEWRTHYTMYLTDNPSNEKVVEHTEEALRTGKEGPPYFVEIRHKDGHPVMLEVSERPYFEGGEVAGIIGVGRDVTDHYRAEEALRESEQRLQGILDNSPAVIYVKDQNGRHALINRRFQKIFHLSREQVLGKTDYEIFPEDVAERLQANDRRVLETTEPIEFEEVVLQDGEPHTYISLKFPLYGAAGRPYAVCGVSTDITERKRAAEELGRAKEAAEAANRAMSAFLANISHEIRTPLTAVLGAAELLATGGSDHPPDPDRSNVILRNGRHLLALIDDLLELSRAEAGKLEVSCVPCSFSDIMTDVQAVVQPLHIRPDVDLRIVYDTPVPARIHTDPTRLKQALINLTNNALKFTETGHVHVRVRVDRDVADPRMAISVEDTGVGISEDALERVFEPFTQLAPASGGVGHGVGLGLPLVKWIAEQLGGFVESASRVGRGSTFTLVIPTGPLEDTEWITLAQSILSHGVCVDMVGPKGRGRLRGSVLVADDFADTRRLMEHALTAQGVTVTAVANGAEAVKAALTHAFDLILMDVRMPEMDGTTATSELRRHGCLAPIIAMTACITAGEQDCILGAGFDDLWEKPISLDALVEGSASYLGSAGDPQEPDPPDSTNSESITDQAGFAAVVAEFVRGLPARIAAIQAALDAEDLEAARNVLHQLVGAGGIHGFMPISREAARLHAMVDDGTLLQQTDVLQALAELVRDAGDSLPDAHPPVPTPPAGGTTPGAS